MNVKKKIFISVGISIFILFVFFIWNGVRTNLKTRETDDDSQANKPEQVLIPVATQVKHSSPEDNIPKPIRDTKWIGACVGDDYAIFFIEFHGSRATLLKESPAMQKASESVAGNLTVSYNEQTKELILTRRQRKRFIFSIRFVFHGLRDYLLRGQMHFDYTKNWSGPNGRGPSAGQIFGALASVKSPAKAYLIRYPLEREKLAEQPLAEVGKESTLEELEITHDCISYALEKLGQLEADTESKVAGKEDEFARRDLRLQLEPKMLDKMNELSVKIYNVLKNPKKSLVRGSLGIELLEYDFEAERFPLKIWSRTITKSGPLSGYSGLVYPSSYRYRTVRGYVLVPEGKAREIRKHYSDDYFVTDCVLVWRKEHGGQFYRPRARQDLHIEKILLLGDLYKLYSD